MNPVIDLLRLLNGFSYKEKSLLVSLLALAGIYGSYFAGLLDDSIERSLGAMLTTMSALVVALVVVHVVFHIVISLDDVEEAADERDKAVRRRAAVAGYSVLFAGVLIVTGRLLVLGALADAGEGSAPDGFELANSLLAALVISEVTFYGAQLCYYRFGFRD